jgi:hypothetical protein
MRLLLKFIMAGFSILLISSCTTYKINVNGYLNSDCPFDLQPDSSFYIAHNPSASNPLLEKEVASKIGKILRDKGFRLAAQEKADFHILFNYGIDRGPLKIGTITHREPASTKSVYTYNYSTGKYDWVQVEVPGSEKEETYSVQNYTRSLSIGIIDAERSIKSGKSEVVWMGETVSEGTGSDLRDVINYLLVATFDYLGQDTGKAVRVRLIRGNPRVKSIK